MKTEAAKASSAIKKELKLHFPSATFTVHSQNFAGGNSVHISWTDGPTTDAVEKITNKYQYGNFDGMTDMYNYDNVRKDIPQAKYVQTQRRMSEEVARKLVEEVKNYYEACKDITFEDMGKYIPELQDNVQSLVYKRFRVLTIN